MAKRKKSCKLDLSNLTKRGKYYDWNKSKGALIPFEYDNGKFTGEFKILKFDYDNGSSYKKLFLELDGKSLKPIIPTDFLSGGISGILFDIYIPWRYDIGDIIENNNDIIIINRKIDRDNSGKRHRYYQIKCLKCGFDSGSYYKDGEYRDSYWIREKDLKMINQCPCCLNRVIIPGKNDVLTLYPDLKKYFCNLEEVNKLAPYSQKIVDVKCPDCGSIYQKSVYRVFINKGVPCGCSDNISYPNKVAYYLFNEMLKQNQIEHHEFEYCPDWSGRYRYDNYIVIKGVPYIVEMDGLLGHGKIAYGKKKPDISGKMRDDIKDELAKQHGITVIRIDCSFSDINYIKSSILSSKLSDILDFDAINWTEIDKKCVKNIYKEICLYYDKTNITTMELSKIFPVSSTTILRALKQGTKLGWCCYTTFDEKTIEREKLILDYCLSHDNYNGSVISKELNINLRATLKILHKLKDDGLISYNPNRKRVGVFSKENELIANYDSIIECVADSKDRFGVSFIGSEISKICLNKGKSHKGYYFKYLK